MGKLLEITCQSCGKTAELRLGYGLLHGRLENVSALFPDEILDQLPLQKMKTFDVPWDFQFVPAVCKACGSFTAVPSIRLTETGEAFMSGCPKCGSEVTAIDLQILKDEPCPSCGQKACISREMGLWD